MSIAWLFPGQGSQVVGMGREIYEEIPAARDVFDQADAALDMNISRLCFEGPSEELTATENAQPALLTFSVAMLSAFAVLAPAGSTAWRPRVVAGHSLGEYSALVAAGALDLVTAVRMVRRRGELMAEADEGTMAAIVGIDADALEAICRDVTKETGESVVIANYNAPDQLVISGTTLAVEQAGQEARHAGARRVLPLKVSAAFHSPLMSRAAEGMRYVIESAHISDLHVPLIANVTAASLTRADEVRQELVEQVVSSVHWLGSVRRMVSGGISTFVEIGPGNVLTGLVKRITPGVRLVNLRTVDDIRAFLKAETDANSETESLHERAHQVC